MHADDGEDIVSNAEDEEEGEEAEEVVSAFEGAGEVVVWAGPVMGFAMDWEGVGAEGLVGEDTSVVLNGFGDEEGDDVVDC